MEAKNQELSRAVEELTKFVKDTGEGMVLVFNCNFKIHYCVWLKANLYKLTYNLWLSL